MKAPTLKRLPPRIAAPDETVANDLRHGSRLLLVDGRRYRVLTVAGKVVERTHFDRATLSFIRPQPYLLLSLDSIARVAPLTIGRCGYPERAQREPFVDIADCYLDGPWRVRTPKPTPPWHHPYSAEARYRRAS